MSKLFQLQIAYWMKQTQYQINMLNVKILVEQSSLIAHIFVEGENDKIINELKIICSGLSENFTYNHKKITIPWYELRRSISGIAYILKRESANLELDDFSKSLFLEAINDRKSIKEKKSSYNIDNDNIQLLLNKIGFSRNLKSEQRRDVLKLLSLKHGANFSVPGAGKTTTLLAVHSLLKEIGIVSKLFVISPINAFISWEDEIKDIFKEKLPTVKRLQKSHIIDFSILIKEQPDIILANYEKLRKDIQQIVPFFINNKVHLILDESHRVKSGTSNISFNQIIKLADLSKRRDILSGTPMPQNYLDLDPQFDFLWPGEKVIAAQSNKLNEENILGNINKSIDGLFVRTTKNELGLEDPIITYKSIQMGPIQSELYKLFKSETARIIAGIDKPNLFNFRRIGRSVIKLLQAATNPILLTSKDEYGEEIFPKPENRDYWELLDDFQKYEKPVKIEYLKKRVHEILNENPKNKILIWSYFVRNILLLERIFKDQNPVTIYGGIPTGSDEDEANREGRIRKFHEDSSCKVMIANPQACGEGISLHKICHHAIYLDRNFNAAYFLQSIDRIHRLGLEQGIKTKVEILISENSIDELLISRLNEKIKAMGSVLEDPYLNSLAYDPADILLEDELGIDSKDYELIKEHVLKK